MPEPEQEVKQPVEPSPTEQTVTESVDTVPQEGAEVAEPTTKTQESQTVVSSPQAEATDEFGVPWKNRAYEHKRKQEELAERLPTLIKDAVSQSIGQHQTQQYSIEQLEAFATQTENPAYQTWAKGEIRKLEKDEQAKVVRGELQKWTNQRQAEDVARQSYDYVKKTYPEAFQRDAQGNVLKWNNNHPLTNMIGELMRNPDLKNRPDALVIASDIAYGRYARIHGATSQQKNQALKREVKNLQKGTLVEGGGRDTSPAVPAHRAAIDRLKQTGSIKDAQAAIAAVMKRASEE